MPLPIDADTSMGMTLAEMMRNKVYGTKMVGLLSDTEVAAWDARSSEITENFRWFSGEALDERDTNNAGKDGKYPLLWPLQLNPIRDAARLHAYALWGMPQDTSGPLVRTKCDPRLDPETLEITDDNRKIANFVDEVLLNIDYENAQRAVDVDMGLAIQALGGLVLKVAWEPGNSLRPSGIRYDYIDPRDFYCRWEGKDYWNLTEAWIKAKVSPETALQYGVTIEGQEGLYLEYWNREIYWITIDGKLASILEADGKRRELNEEHGFGFVPILYIPHERVNEFWGRSIVEGNIGAVKELNSREADFGDAVHLSVNSTLIGRNIRGGHPVQSFLADGTPWQNLGRNNAGEDKAEMERVESANLPVGATEFVDRLRENLRNGLLTPSIAYGEEEGSQRSGQTLHNRLWPLLSHVTHERVNWTEGRSRRAEMALQILKLKKQQGITEKHLGLRKRQLWAPMVPVDRTALVDEIIKRKQEDSISLEHMLELAGDVPDIQEEMKRIYAMLEKMAEIESAVEKLKIDAQAKLADKQMANQSELADKAANTQVEIAKSKPKPAASKGN